MTQANIPSILQKIVRTKETEVAALEQAQSLLSIKALAEKTALDKTEPRRGFANALRRKQGDNIPAIIAEIKKASPSKGIISPNFDAEAIAKSYEQAGAACLSVLTDEQYFQGHNRYLQQAKAACALPVLRKDFMISAYQIYESYLLGADCILLIVACLDDKHLHDLHSVAIHLGLDVLIEVHTHDELARALTLPYTEHNIYGINNRDLNTFETDLQTSIKLADMLMASLSSQVLPIPPLLVTESGLHNQADMQLMLDADIDCFLIGEQFMKTDNPGATLAELLATL